MISPVSRPRAILLVDDQRFVGAALSLLLSDEDDLEIHCCTDAANALAQALSIRPSLILQDLVMPDISGLALVRTYRENPIIRSTPIIVLSAHDDDAIRAEALDAGADDYLTKLPAREPLIACVRRWIDEAVDSRPASVPALGDHDALDDEALHALLDVAPADGGRFVASLFEQFLVEATAQVCVLNDACRQSDLSIIRTTAHSLKGCALTVGANRLAALCGRLESDVATSATPALLAATCQAIGVELDLVRHACTRTCDRLLT